MFQKLTAFFLALTLLFPSGGFAARTTSSRLAQTDLQIAVALSEGRVLSEARGKTPVIGVVRPKLARENDLAVELARGNSGAMLGAITVLYESYRQNKLGEGFGAALRMSRGNMDIFSRVIVGAYDRYMTGEERDPAFVAALVKTVRGFAQDHGAPYDTPPASYFNPARYVYSLLQRRALDRFVADTVSDVVHRVRRAARGRNLDDIRQKAEVVRGLREAFGVGRQTRGSFQYEIFYDSLVEKDGERYLMMQVLLGDESAHRRPAVGEERPPHYRDAVVVDLLITIPAVRGGAVRYENPYDIASEAAEDFRVGLLDPIHFINERFPEWRPRDQRDIYEARVEALAQGGPRRQYLRPSVRQGNNPRIFFPVLDEYLEENAPLLYHIVATTRSERQYANQNGVTAPAAIAGAIVARGGIGVTASRYLADPASAATLVGRQLVYSFELDHHRVDDVKEAGPFARNLAYFLLTYDEALATGWPSANLQDETALINQKAREWLFVVETVAKNRSLDVALIRERLKNPNFEWNQQTYEELMRLLGYSSVEEVQALLEQIRDTGVVPDEVLFALFNAIYHDQGVTEGLPNALDFHWLRNTYLQNAVDTLGREAGMTPFARFYIEPDFAIDMDTKLGKSKAHTAEEFMYLAVATWLSAKAQGHPFGPMVPSNDNVHGASAGDPSLALAGVLQYAAQTAVAFADEPSPEILAIARKAPRGLLEKLRALRDLLTDEEVEQRDALNRLIGLVEERGERRPDEENALRDYIQSQLALLRARAPEGTLEALKEAERQRKPLAEVSPEAKDRLDQSFRDLPVDRRAWITTHAASGLSAVQLRQAKDYGVVAANKSTEFQNIVFRVIRLIALLHTDPDRAMAEFQKLPGYEKIKPLLDRLTPAEIKEIHDLYTQLHLAAAKRAGKEPVPDFEFPWFWRPEDGWSMTDTEGKNWKAYDFITGAHGRFMFSMRADMTGEGETDDLLFPNALTWGLPDAVIGVIQVLFAETIRFYQRPEVMNAVGGAAEMELLARGTGERDERGKSEARRADDLAQSLSAMDLALPRFDGGLQVLAQVGVGPRVPLILDGEFAAYLPAARTLFGHQAPLAILVASASEARAVEVYSRENLQRQGLAPILPALTVADAQEALRRHIANRAAEPASFGRPEGVVLDATSPGAELLRRELGAARVHWLAPARFEAMIAGVPGLTGVVRRFAVYWRLAVMA